MNSSKNCATARHATGEANGLCIIADYDPRPHPATPQTPQRRNRLDSVGQYTNLPRAVQEKHFARNAPICA
jgi:hypothetical protein